MDLTEALLKSVVQTVSPNLVVENQGEQLTSISSAHDHD